MDLFVRSLAVLVLFFGAPWALAHTNEESTNIRFTLKLNELKNKQGLVCVSLFSNEEGFPADGQRATFSKCFPTQDIGDNGELGFEAPLAESYALALFHDQNGDRQLNTGAFGIPLEGFAFSNNPKIRFSAPKFNDCSFMASETNVTLSLDIKSFF